MKQLKIDLSVPIEGGPLDGHAVAYDHDTHPEPLPSIAPTGLIPSRGIVLPVALPAGYEDASVYRLLWIGEHHDEPVYRWRPTHSIEGDHGADRLRARLVEALGLPAGATLAEALEEAYRLADCANGGSRHKAIDTIGCCTGCGRYFNAGERPVNVPTTLAEAIKRVPYYRVREADQSVFSRHRAVLNHGRFTDEHGDICPHPGACGCADEPKVCLTCRDNHGDPVMAPCDDFSDLARRYGFDPEGLVS